MTSMAFSKGAFWLSLVGNKLLQDIDTAFPEMCSVNTRTMVYKLLTVFTTIWALVSQGCNKLEKNCILQNSSVRSYTSKCYMTYELMQDVLSQCYMLSAATLTNTALKAKQKKKLLVKIVTTFNVQTFWAIHVKYF